jgi:pentatricopeptide repeat domain-containing protein 1
MHNLDLSPDTNTYNIIFNSCAKQMRANVVAELIKMMERHGLRMNRTSYASALCACQSGKRADAHLALQLLEQMRREGFCLEHDAYKHAVRACVASGEVGLALGLLDEMAEAGLELSAAFYGSALQAYKGVGKSSKGEGIGPDTPASHAAELLFEDMRSRGVRPNALTYTAAIAACADSGRADLALRFLGEMRAGVPDAEVPKAAFDAAIKACVAGGEAEAAGGLLAEMGAATGQTPGVRAYTTAIASCREGGRSDLALGLLDEMRGQGVEPNVVTYTAGI